MEQRLRIRCRRKLILKPGLLPLKCLELGVHGEGVSALNDGFDQLVDLLGHSHELFLARSRTSWMRAEAYLAMRAKLRDAILPTVSANCGLISRSLDDLLWPLFRRHGMNPMS
jgi:hypothetical protein